MQTGAMNIIANKVESGQGFAAAVPATCNAFTAAASANGSPLLFQRAHSFPKPRDGL